MNDAFMTDRVTLRRAYPAPTVSSTGTAREEWRTVKANIRASVQKKGTAFRLRESGLNNATGWIAYFHGKEDIRVNDEIVTAAGMRFKAHSVYNLGEHQQVEIEPHEE